jgi:hypothetical protein
MQGLPAGRKNFLFCLSRFQLYHALIYTFTSRVLQPINWPGTTTELLLQLKAQILHHTGTRLLLLLQRIMGPCVRLVHK